MIFRKNKRGLSEVVTSVIIILLVIAAIVLIWTIVNNFLQRGGETFASQVDCISNPVSIEAFSKIDADPTDTNLDSYSVTVKRTSGDDQVTGFYLVFSGGGKSAAVNTFAATPIDAFATRTETIGFSAVGDVAGNADRVEVIQYVNGKRCQQVSGSRSISA
jgi:flagellin-like protein